MQTNAKLSKRRRNCPVYLFILLLSSFFLTVLTCSLQFTLHKVAWFIYSFKNKLEAFWCPRPPHRKQCSTFILWEKIGYTASFDFTYLPKEKQRKRETLSQDTAEDWCCTSWRSYLKAGLRNRSILGVLKPTRMQNSARNWTAAMASAAHPVHLQCVSAGGMWLCLCVWSPCWLV